MLALRSICDDLREHLPEILVEWSSLTTEEPWLSLPQEHRLNNLPNVVIDVRDVKDPELLVKVRVTWPLRKLAVVGRR